MYPSGILTAKGDLAQAQVEGGTRQACLKICLKVFFLFFLFFPLRCGGGGGGGAVVDELQEERVY